MRQTLKYGIGSIALILTASIAIATAALGQPISGKSEPPAQSLAVSANADVQIIQRDSYTITSLQDRVTEASSTKDQEAWAKAILVYGGWPETKSSITVIQRWMRQENYVDNWWLRNNPLNNGWGVGNYMNPNPNLLVAAQRVADAIKDHYPGIDKAFTNGEGESDIWAAIWTSGWASGMYAEGTHYSTAPLVSVKAPDDAWGF